MTDIHLAIASCYTRREPDVVHARRLAVRSELIDVFFKGFLTRKLRPL